MESHVEPPQFAADPDENFGDSHQDIPDRQTVRMEIGKPRIEKVESGKIEIAWDKIQDADEYEITCIKRAKGKEQFFVYFTKNQRYTINGIVPGHEYQLFVKGDGAVSEAISVISGPLAPANVKAVADPSSPCDSVCVSFEDPDEHPKFFEIVISDTNVGGEKRKQQTETTFATIRELKPGHAYKIYVQSVQQNPYPGPKELCSKKSYAPAEIKTAPAKVTGASAHYLGNGAAEIKWDHPEGATGFDIEWTDGEGDSTKRTHSTNEYTMRGLVLGKTYTVIIAAKNEERRGLFSDPSVIRTEPTPPSGLKVSHFDRSPHTTLIVSLDESNGKDREFVFFARLLITGEEKKTIVSKSAYAVIGDLVPGEVYRISAMAVQHGLESEKITYQRPIHMYPDQPKNVKGFIKGGCLHITWDELEVKPNKYEIEIERNGEKFTQHTTRNSCVLKNTKSSAIYGIRVAGVNNGGRGRFSEDSTLYTDPAPPTNARFALNESAPKTSLIVTFDHHDSPTTYYEITAEPTSDEEGDRKKISKTSDKLAIFHGLTPGKKYSVKVVAVSGDLDGQPRKSVPVYCIPK